MPRIRSEAVVTTKVPEKKKKEKESNFLITLNTNKFPRSQLQSSEMVKELGRGLRTMTTEEEHLKAMIKFLTPGDVYSDDTILTIDSKYTVERGKKKGRIHAHVWIRIKHTSMIHLDREAIKEALKASTGGVMEVPYVNIRAIRKDPFSDVKKYLGKDNLYEETDVENLG